MTPRPIEQRPLEFRAWDKKNKAWINPDWFSILGNGTLIDSNTIDLKNCIVQQFCGLYDKNKKKIFEGDLIKDETRKDVNDKDYFSIYKVTYGECGACGYDECFLSIGFYLIDQGLWRDEKFEPRKDETGLLQIDKPEVIGNICENPDLLSA